MKPSKTSSSSPSSSPFSSPSSLSKLFAGSIGVAALGFLVWKLLSRRKNPPSLSLSQSAITGPSLNSMDVIPIIKLENYLNRNESKNSDSVPQWHLDCSKIANCLKEYGILIIEDPRVDESENEKFLDLLEQYYEQSDEVRSQDVRKEFHYQVGTTPKGIEHARDHCERIAKLDRDNKPLTLCPPEKDPKSRFFWRMGEIPPKTEFESLNMPPVIPKAFPQWPIVMNRWGTLMLQGVQTVAEMAAIGMGFQSDTFTNLMKFGPHLLAPTASDLGADGKVGTVFANYHYDLNFLTIHGRSRFPGLFIWTRQGKRMQVKVPPNCLLIQAGIQFEWLTGGEVMAGFHEVVVVPDTLKAVEKAKAEKRSLWRISSTLFSHIASDQYLQPLGKFANEETLRKYPPTKAGTQVKQELEKIKLAV